MEFGLYEIWMESSIVGKGVFVALALMSVGVIYVGVERALAVAKARRLSEEYAKALEPLIEANRLDGAKDIKSDAPLAIVLGSGVARYIDNRSVAPTTDDLMFVVEQEMERKVGVAMAGIRRGIGFLATIATISPFVGLFGTIVGIIRSFQDIAADGGGSIATVGAGIAEALYATALGIFVAVIAVVLFNMFSTRFDALQADLTAAATRLAETLRAAEWRRGGRRAEAAE